MNVSATVRYSCSIDTTPMAFGAYDGVVANASIALEATATVISTCTSGTAAHHMNAGASAGSGSTDAPVRRMTAGARKYLVYQVYSDVARETVWGNTVPTGVALTGTGALKPIQFMAVSHQRKWCPRGIIVTRSSLQLLTDAVTDHFRLFAFR